jgi:hypothetical protein
MAFVKPHPITYPFSPQAGRSPKARHRRRAASAFALLVASALPASAASLTRQVDIDATPFAVWSAIGSFCAIADWHPAIATCTVDGKTPPTRTLVTKDGKATFVEKEFGRQKFAYSYTFVSSPLPVVHYRSTLKVSARAGGHSTVTWSGVYAPDAGKEADAVAALSGIYEAGLQAIKVKFAR